ncbi:ArnT family glycosyltransferase [Terriglobus aquaticus]|uniref:ArnT family glycosyltransferase n=1 Tax=Terriglobus aquaticus TaxID=940139 RepID=A0ABW9KLN5_9BACT|nr:glycosyl transferase [Terriglobus aquaticus]
MPIASAFNGTGTEQVAAANAARDASRVRLLSRAAVVCTLLVVAVFFALRFLHLRADFPNFSPWSDWAKYTDEGWYGDAAMRHYLLGTWHLPGDFNPAAALPVWPLLEAIVFRFTGVGIVAARTLTVVVFGGILLASFALLRGGMGRSVREEPLPWAGLCAATAALLMAVSPYFYVFSRMAVLEPLLVLLMLIALLLARGVAWQGQRWPAVALPIAIGVVLALMVGTKTTAVALVPSIAYLLASACGWKLRATARSFAWAGGTTVVLWGAYYLALIRPRYLQDFRYLFSANRYTGITADNARDIITSAFRDVTWMGSGITALLAAALVFAVVRRRVWSDPLIPTLMLWIAGYFAFLIYHANLQPRYYLVVAVPITLLVMRLVNHAVAWRWQTAVVVVPALLVLVAVDARQTLHYVRHPEYTFQNAAEQIEQVVESEPAHSHTVLSISGSDLTLMTGLPSICDDFGTMELEDRIAAYKPGWFVAWNYVEDDKMDALANFYRLTRVREIPAMDDPDRNLLIVYRLDPKESVKPRKGRSKRS